MLYEGHIYIKQSIMDEYNEYIETIKEMIDTTLVNVNANDYRREMVKWKYLNENNEVDEEFDWLLDILTLKIPTDELLNSYQMKNGELITYFIYALNNEYYEDLIVIKNQLEAEYNYTKKCLQERKAILKSQKVLDLSSIDLAIQELESVKEVVTIWLNDITNISLK